MKIVVIGGSGLIGKKLIPILRKRGHEAVPASPSSGVNTLTGEGLAQALEGADVIIMLRVQTERLDDPPLSADDYILLYQLNAEWLRRASPNAIVLHPGPINRGIEITPEVADGPQSCVLEQVPP